MSGIQTHNISGDRHSGDCIGSWKSNYHVIMTNDFMSTGQLFMI
jgi:hypothetical protein